MKALTRAFIILAALLATSPAGARSATRDERAACEAAVQRKIDAIDARMRAAYGVREGERMRERRRRLEEQRADCRTVDDSTRAPNEKPAQSKRPRQLSLPGPDSSRRSRGTQVFEAW